MSFPVQNRTDGRFERVVDSATLNNLIVSWVLYGVEGCILTVTNFPIVLAVILYSKLRQQKEFIIIGALALADGLAGFAFLLAAIGRISAVQEGTAFILTTRWRCLLSPWVIIWGWCQPLTALMLVVVSVDRLIAVTFPLRYYGFTNRYAYVMVGCAYGFVFIPFSITAYGSYQIVIPDVPAYCGTNDGMTVAGYAYFTNFILACTTISVVLYIPVLLKLKYALNSNAAIDNSTKFQRLKTATIALGISSFFTFLLYIVPMAIISFQFFTNNNIFYLMLNLNAMVNIFIYFTRFKEIRVGLKSLITCRTTLVLDGGTRGVADRNRNKLENRVSIQPRAATSTNAWTH